MKIVQRRASVFFKHKAVQNLIKSGQHFDLFILDNDIGFTFLGLAGHFRVPSVIFTVLPPTKILRDVIGNPTSLSAPVYRYDKKVNLMRFTERLIRFVEYAFEFSYITYLNYFYFEPFYNEHFAKIENFPTFNDIKKNVSLILTNTHFSEGIVRPLLPNLIEIGGVQLKEKTDPLPNVRYFSYYFVSINQIQFFGFI